MIRHLKLLLDPECCNEMPCDDIGRRPVLWVHLGGVWEGHTRLLHRQAGEPPPRDYLPNPLEAGVEEHRSLGGSIISSLDNGAFVGLIYKLLVFS